MKRILFFVLMLSAFKGFSQNDSSSKPKGQNHLSFQKGKSELVISGTYRLKGEIQQNFNAKCMVPMAMKPFCCRAFAWIWNIALHAG